MHKSLIFTLSFLVLGLVGCASKAPELADSGVPTVAQAGNSPELAADSQISSMAGMDEKVSFGSVDERITAIEKDIEPIYFATDSYRISASELHKIDKDAQVFNSELARDLSIKVEGNCDEWGTDEYNYALGLKRAKTVRDALALKGVDKDRMVLISYGESNPVCTEHTKECWAKNRRVEFELLP